MKKGKLRIIDDGRVAYYCIACKQLHMLNISNPNLYPSWTFNGDYDKPTFSPSVLLTQEYKPESGKRAYVCHSFITDGKIQYLSDCTHELAGQTIDMVEA